MSDETCTVEWSGFTHYPCDRPGTIEVDGGLFCDECAASAIAEQRPLRMNHVALGSCQATVAKRDGMTMRIATPSGRLWEWTWSEAGGVDEVSWQPSEGWESSRGMYCEDDAAALLRAAEVLQSEPGSTLTLHGTACTSSSAPKAQKTSP